MSSAGRMANVGIRILRLREVCKVTGLSRSKIYRLRAQRRFPQSIKITARAVGWVEQEVQAWLAQRIASSRLAALASAWRK